MNQSRKDSSAGIPLIATASILYATYGIWAKLMGSTFSAFTQAWIRAVIVAACMFAIAWLMHGLTRIDFKDRTTRKWLLVLLFANAFIQGPMYYSVNHAGVGLSMAVGYGTAVLAAYILGWAINRELITGTKRVSLALGLLGLVAVYFSSLNFINTAALSLAVLSGIVAAVDIIALQKLKFGVLQAAGLSWLAVAITSLPLAFAFHETLPSLSQAGAWMYLLIFAATSLLASWIHTTGLRKVEANIVGLFGLLEIVFAVIFGMLLFNENLGAVQIVGIVLILVACAVPYLSQKGIVTVSESRH